MVKETFNFFRVKQFSTYSCNMFSFREMLEQSLGELQITVQELQKKVDSVDDESTLNSCSTTLLTVYTLLRGLQIITAKSLLEHNPTHQGPVSRSRVTLHAITRSTGCS